jgi:hypothetical protein
LPIDLHRDLTDLHRYQSNQASTSEKGKQRAFQGLENEKISSVSQFNMFYFVFHYIKSHQDEKAEELHHAASQTSHKRAKSSPSTGNDRRKVQRKSTAEAFSDVKNTMGSAMDSLTAAIRSVGMAPAPALETMFSVTISTVAKDADFSQDDMDDAFKIFMINPWVAETYAAIMDASARTHFLCKRLGEFQREKYDGIRND